MTNNIKTHTKQSKNNPKLPIPEIPKNLEKDPKTDEKLDTSQSENLEKQDRADGKPKLDPVRYETWLDDGGNNYPSKQ